MGLTTVIRSALALATALLLGGVLLAAAPTASARATSSAERGTDTARLASCNWRAHQCFGAISLNTRTGVVGFANDRRSRSKATSVAQRMCKARSVRHGGSPGQCTRAGWVRNGCLAVAIRIRHGSLVEWGSGFDYDPDQAQAKAKRKVRGLGRERVQYWICTTRSH